MKKHYSGKKKAHRKKNLLLSSEQRVVYLGPTSPGSVHDKKLADESGLTYPADALVLEDTGFQGYEPPDCTTLQPKKKPRNRELHPIQKTINQIISKVRVTVEHAIAAIKRCHSAADLFRNRRPGFVDEVTLAEWPAQPAGSHPNERCMRISQAFGGLVTLQTPRAIRSNLPRSAEMSSAT